MKLKAKWLRLGGIMNLKKIKDSYLKISHIANMVVSELEGWPEYGKEPYKPSKADLIAWKEDIIEEIVRLEMEAHDVS